MPPLTVDAPSPFYDVFRSVSKPNLSLLRQQTLIDRISMKNASNYLRKRRKWPLSPYKAKWHESFHQIQAMETLKQSNKPYLLHNLVNSFKIYNSAPTPQAYHFIINKLAHKPHEFHHLHPILDRIEKVETFETPEILFVNLTKMYANAGMIDEAINVFYRIPQSRCIPTAISLNALLFIVCKNNDWIVRVPEIIMRSLDMRIRFEESSYRILITALCRIKRTSYAIRLLDCMLKDGYCIDFRICSVILSSLCAQCEVDSVEVMRFLESVRKSGFVPDMVDAGNVIKFLVKGGRGGEALSVLNQMKLDRIKPDIACYTMVLKGVILEEDYEKADELFDELLVLGLVPDIRTYNVYLEGLCKQYKVELGYKMLGCMADLGCKPDSITYNIILEGYCKAGKIDRGKEVVNEMKLKGVCVNSYTYRIMIDGMFIKGEIVEACDLLEEMLDKYECIQSSIVDRVIYELCARGMSDKCVKLLQRIAGTSTTPGVMGWKALVSGSKLGFAETTWIDLVNPIRSHLV